MLNPRGLSYQRRRAADAFMTGLAFLAAAAAIGVLVVVLAYIVVQGATALSPAFFTQVPKPVGEPGGGMANAIVGTLYLVALACVIGLPIGIGAGIYLAEYGRQGRLASLVRFVTDVLTGVPSIVIGIFAYTIIVLTMRGFSALAGSVALAIIMIPIVTKAAEEIIRLVPNDVREASLAVGATRSQTIIRVVLPSAGGGILTGVMLAIARAAGETAPLLFTAFGNRFWNLDPTKPIAAMPLQIFNYAISPYEDWHAQAWAGALVLVALVLITSVTARFFARRTHNV
ncbi:MAG: phosphate ABC transporter permease PstA [Chloroflexi bacterium]|nr:phosphate ABC transporter permease PstA [Chloroflexota bacterium]